MSDRIVAQEIRELVALFNESVRADGLPTDVAADLFISPGDLQQVITQAAISAGTATLEFTVPGDHCLVVVVIELFNVDQSSAQTTSQAQDGGDVTQDFVAQGALGADLFYVYPKGLVQIVVNATPGVGATAHGRAVGYLLPFRCYSRLARMATKNV